MPDDVVTKWKGLLATLTVVGQKDADYSEADVQKAERDLGFSFPAGYPEYCQVFGTGGFGKGFGFFRLYCPRASSSGKSSLGTDHCLMGLHQDLENADDDGVFEDEPEKAAILNRLLEHGYPFGDTANADTLFWDVTTYNDVDRSYDIYWVPDELPLLVTPVGRDFYQFVRDFCLGNKPVEILPEEYGVIASEEQQPVFTRFENTEEDDDHDTEQFATPTIEDIADWGIFSDHYSGGGSAITVTASYDAADRDQAELLKADFEQQGDADVVITSPGNRRQLSSMVEVRIPNVPPSRESIIQVLTIMVSIGQKHNCPVTSTGYETKTD